MSSSLIAGKMEKYINCIAHKTSDGNLLIGEEKTALFDCGMTHCADVTIKNVKNALNGRTLDYLFISHTHYDHIGALPFFRKEWPSLRLVTTQTGAAVLLKDTPRKVIRELSIVAINEYNSKIDASTYNDDDFHADILVKEGDIIPLGGFSVEILETPGHTRDALSFFIPELELLIISETMGVLFLDNLYPLYLTSFKDTISSIEKCSKKPYKYLSLPHCGIAPKKDAINFFNRAAETAVTCKDFILDMYEKKFDQETMYEMFFKKYKTLLSYQPREAFEANARATIACTLRDFGIDNNIVSDVIATQK